MILGFSLVIIATAIFSKTNRLPGKVAGTATSPLLINNKFCDNPAETAQAGCTSFIPSALAATLTSPYQNVNGDVTISGVASFNNGVGPCCANYYTVSINEGGTNQPTLQFHDSGVAEGQIILQGDIGGGQRGFRFQSVQTSVGGRFTGNLLIDGKIGIGTATLDQKLTVKGGGIGFDYNSADKKLYSPADGVLEWMTHNSAGQHGFAVSHQGDQRVFLNTSGSSYFFGGALGVGTRTPGAALEVDGGNRAVRIRNTGAAAGKYWAIGPDTNNNFTIYNQTNLGAWLADSSPSSWRFTSDQRLKTNIQTLSGEKGLAAIEKLNPVSFNWIGRNPSATQLGLIAQQVQNIFPELVSEGPSSTINLPDGSTQTITNTLGLDYTGLIPSLIKAIQQQQEQIQNQQQAINELRQEIQQLKQGR